MAKLSIFIAFAIISVALSEPVSEADPMKIPVTGQHKFSRNFFNIIRENNPGRSVFISPLSAYNALTLAYFGSEGEAMASLHEVLNFESKDGKAEVLKKYRKTKALSTLEEKLKSVEKVYVTNKAELNAQVTGELADIVEAVDFSTEFARQARRHEINAYVERFTDNHLKEVLQPNDVTGVDIILMNAAYFHAVWQRKFDVADTKPKMFYGEKPAEVQMMYQSGRFLTGSVKGVNANYLMLPYERSAISMIVFLPNKKSPAAVDEMLNGFTDQTLASVLEEAYESKRSLVDVRLPRMSRGQTTYELDGVFQEMGVKNLFGRPLTGYSNTTDLSIDAFNQITRLDVDEEGTTASAVTVSVAKGLVWKEQFNCDHPFAYMIYNSNSNEIVFSGVFRGPNN